MPQSLPPVPSGVPWSNPEDGTLTEFALLRWQDLINGFQTTPSVAAIQHLTQNASIATATAWTTRMPGNYRIGVAVLKTVADGVTSSLTVTVGWTRGGIARTKTFAALTTDAAGANDCNLWQFYADGATNLTYAIAYASNTPGQMKYHADITIERLA